MHFMLNKCTWYMVHRDRPPTTIKYSTCALHGA